MSEAKTSQKQNVTGQNFIQIQSNKIKRHADKMSLNKSVYMMAQETKCQLEKCHRTEICHTNKMARHTIKTPLRQNATLEDCHKTKRHFDTPL